MYTLFEQIILHRCVFAFCRHAFASASRAFVHRNVLARDAPASLASRTAHPHVRSHAPRIPHLHASQRAPRAFFPLLLRWSPFNISLEWLCEYFI